MARKDKLAGMKMPAMQEDEMLEMDEMDMAELPEEEEMAEESEMDLTGAADEDLVAELEARGYMIEAPEEEAEGEMEMEDEDEMMA